MGPENLTNINKETINNHNQGKKFKNTDTLYQSENDFLQQENTNELDSISLDHQNINQNEDINNIPRNTQMFDSQMQPKIKDYVEYKLLNSDEIFKTQILSKAGKASGKYSSWFNVRNLDDDSISNID